MGLTFIAVAVACRGTVFCSKEVEAAAEGYACTTGWD